MHTLQAMRESRTTIRWMLVWFCMAIGVAIAAPALHPQTLTLVCTAEGATKLVVPGNDGELPQATKVHTLDCVFCLSSGAPPSAELSVVTPQDLTVNYQPAYVALLVWRTADPTSARDPPDIS